MTQFILGIIVGIGISFVAGMGIFIYVIRKGSESW